ATDTTAVESPNSTGAFLVQLSAAAPTGGVTVNFTMSGSAVPADYALTGNALSFNAGNSTGSIAIPAGSSSATITLTPVNDGNVETSETARLTVTTGAGYTVTGSAAT